MRIFNSLATLASAAIMLTVFAVPSYAQLYWDKNGSSSGAGANNQRSGTWNDSNNFWGNSSGTANTIDWIPGQYAYFSAGDGFQGVTTNVELGDDITAGGLAVVNENSTIRIRDNSGNDNLALIDTFGGNIPAFIYVEDTSELRIEADLEGNDGLYVFGSGELDLRGDNEVTGTTQILDTRVELRGGSALDDNSRVILANQGARLEVLNSETIGSLTGTGTVDINNRTLTVGEDGSDYTFAGTIVGSNTGSRLRVTGEGTATLTGNSTYRGFTEIENQTTLVLASTTGEALEDTREIIVEGGTLLLANSNQINDQADLTLDGGTLALGGNSETLDSLTLDDDSTIDMGSGNAVLTFSSGNLGNNTLTIVNWNGIPGQGGGNDQIIFTQNLSNQFLEDVFWAGLNQSGAQQLGTGELVPLASIQPVPEPSTIIGGLFLAGLVAGDVIRRRRKAKVVETAA